MIKRTIQQMTQMIAGTAQATYGDIRISGVSTDSRNIEKGNLFIPIAGDRYDGHAFVPQAIEQGAAAAFWQEDHPDAPEGVPLIYVKDTLAALQELAAAYRRELPVRVIGVTGSNGKTTTKDMVAACLETTYRVHKTQGNFNNHIGLPLTLLQISEDTEMAVLEMGMSERGEIEFLSKLATPEAAIITNIGESHLAQLGTREAIAAAKLEIVSGLREDGLLVYNGDEPLIEERLEPILTHKSLLRFRFGEDEHNDYYPLAIMQISNGISFKLNVAQSPSYFIPLLGNHNVMNAMSAVAVAKFMGVSEADIVKGLKNLQATSMRSEMLAAPNGATIFNDAYNASPTSMRAAIRLMEDLRGYERKILVLGDMLDLGEKEEQYHREIGQLLDPHKIDYVFTYGNLASFIAEEAERRYIEGHVHAFYDKDILVAKLSEMLDCNDVCLVKGSRGMKLEDVIRELL